MGAGQAVLARAGVRHDEEEAMVDAAAQIVEGGAQGAAGQAGVKLPGGEGGVAAAQGPDFFDDSRPQIGRR